MYQYNMYGVPLTFSVQGHFGVIQCACLKMACNSKRDDYRAKQTEIWDLGLVVWHRLSTFECNYVKMTCNLKKKDWLQSKMGWNVGLMLTSRTRARNLWPFSLQGHFGVIRCICSKMACNSKTADWRPERAEIWDSGYWYGVRLTS